jgi:hypothetical protein
MSNIAEYVTVITVDDYFATTVSKLRIVGWTRHDGPVYERRLNNGEFVFDEESDGSLLSMNNNCLRCRFASLGDARKWVVEFEHRLAEQNRANAESDRLNGPDPDEPPF